MSQLASLITHLKSGKSIDRVQAFQQYGVGDLRSRISDIERQGIMIDRETVPSKRYLRYFIKP